MDDPQTIARNIITQNAAAMQEIVELYQVVISAMLARQDIANLDRLPQLIEAINRLDQKVQQDLKAINIKSR